MGINLAEAVYDQYPALSHRQKILLVRMALIADDDEPAPTFSGSWELLAQALGFQMPDSSDWPVEADRLELKARHNVARAVGDLKGVGAIASKRRGGHGQRAVYLLNIRTHQRDRLGRAQWRPGDQ
ncbi:hypothetical protein [Aeromicrobium sp. A1-2]|uniref:hypothetical protein n=1 Tax=Aeromicrobium sp. A1-2 TaxID=2107713 RepID=UPI0013C2D50D|nr:hypothetical protein [Aeromicrobium sp. A1-2]